MVLTYNITEWRAGKFKAQSQADQHYNQRATDSLLNFETVKYFNAEKHEEKRFGEALYAYKQQVIVVANSLVALNIIQAFIISLGLVSTLMLATYFVSLNNLTVGGFVMFNSYNLQIYTPLAILGSLWRFVRQSMVDVEQVLNLLEADEKISEEEKPEPCNVSKGQIEFKNVSFTYDIKLP